jgi:hypothetical protein
MGRDNVSAIGSQVFLTAGPGYRQIVINQIREDMIDLQKSLLAWMSTNQPDIGERVQNWHFNTWQRMEEVLRNGKT